MPGHSSALWMCILLCGSASVAQQRPEFVMQMSHHEPISAAAFSPDGKMLLSGGIDGVAILWDIESGRGICQFNIGGNIEYIGFPTNTRAFLGVQGARHADAPLKAIQVWDTAQGKELTEAAPYSQGDMRIAFTAKDARQMSQVLGDKLEGTRQFADVVRIRLVSDTPEQHEAGEAAATKAHLQAVLDVLAGRRKLDEQLKKEIPGIERVEKAEPEDLVLLSFSRHGYTDTRGVFHIVLWDIGKTTPQDKITAALERNSLSSDVLSGWLRDVDAGEMTMIVDACHSEATVAAEGFKSGPMGSRGLGQLAYDKGMRILAASKSNEEAMELGGNIK
jgi:hypothetical protein